MQALMWIETKDRAWPRHRRRAALRRPARAIQPARPRPIRSGWCPPDDARSGNAARDRGAAVQRARLFCDQSGRYRRLGPGSAATVYAVSGGEQGLLRTLTETATTDPAIKATNGSIEKLDDPSAILRIPSRNHACPGSCSALGRTRHDPQQEPNSADAISSL